MARLGPTDRKPLETKVIFLKLPSSLEGCVHGYPPYHFLSELASAKEKRRVAITNLKVNQKKPSWRRQVGSISRAVSGFTIQHGMRNGGLIPQCNNAGKAGAGTVQSATTVRPAHETPLYRSRGTPKCRVLP